MPSQEVNRRARIKALNVTRMKDAGLTCREIAERIGRDNGSGNISVGRVSQILAKGRRIEERQREKNRAALKESRAVWQFNGCETTFSRYTPDRTELEELAVELEKRAAPPPLSDQVTPLPDEGLLRWPVVVSPRAQRMWDIHNSLASKLGD